MRRKGELRYKVECMVCGRRFIVSSISSPVPKHPPKGQHAEPHMPYVPCVGSGTVGIPIEPVI